MIRVLIESLLLFLLPSAVYFTYALATRPPGTSLGSVAARAPTLLLSVFGAAMVFTIMVLFGKVGDGRPGQAYVPAVVDKDGNVVPGRMR